VLSDPNKRILYDVGAYDSDGDDDVRPAQHHTTNLPQFRDIFVPAPAES
jgi:hypothetical protein